MDETEQGYGIEYVVLADGFRVLKRCSGDRRQNVDRDRIRTDLAEFKREFGSLSVLILSSTVWVVQSVEK